MAKAKDDLNYQLMKESDVDNAEGDVIQTNQNSKYGTNEEFKTQEKPTGKSKPLFPIIMLTMLSTIGGFLFGYDTGVISGAMLALKVTFHLDYVWQELIVSITIAGAALSAAMAGPINDYYGRKKVILAGSVIFTVGAVMLGAAYSKEVLVLGRLVVGLGIGLASMTVPMYISESSLLEHRGKLTVVYNVSVTAGQMIAGITDGIFFADHVNGWRFMLGLAGIPSLIQFIGFIFMPESPRWLVVNGREVEARKVLVGLRGPDEDVAAEIESIRKGHDESVKASCRSDGDTSPVFIRMLRHEPTRRALVLGCGLQIFQQLVGINTVMYYSATILQMSGIRDPHKAVWIAAVTATVNFFSGSLGIFFVEYLGRRRLTLASLFGVTLSLIVLAIGFQINAFTSPSINIHQPPPANFSYSDCFLKTSCSRCVDQQDCGFCYMEPPASSKLLAVNGTCLSTKIGFGDKSLYGSCSSRQEMKASDHIWSYGYCPTLYSWITIFGLVMYLLCFSPGMGPMAWTINSEIYPTWARSTGMAASTTFNWISNLLISMTFLSLTLALTRYGTFWLYTGFALIGFIFLYVALPETKGKTLEETEELFRKPWNFLCFKF